MLNVLPSPAKAAVPHNLPTPPKIPGITDCVPPTLANVGSGPLHTCSSTVAPVAQ